MVEWNNIVSKSEPEKGFIPEEYGESKLSNMICDVNYKSQSSQKLNVDEKDYMQVSNSIPENDLNSEMISEPEIGDPIEFILSVISKEVKNDDKLIRQILHTMLSSATKNPIDLAINASTGEGKSYALLKVGSLFSDDVVISLSGMTEKALFHKKGSVVIKSGEGKYSDVGVIARDINRRLKKIKNQTKKTKNSNEMGILDGEVDRLETELERLKNEAVKLIELEGKVLIFMDTPQEKLFSALMPLLSHDKYETTYSYVDKDEGIETNTNILRGFPSFIFSQAIDFSGYARAEEIQRRFLISNPKMDIGKYKEAADLTTLKYSVPDEIYQNEVVSDKQRQKAKRSVAKILKNIQNLSRTTKSNRNNVIIPYGQTVRKSLNIAKALDMTSTEQIFNCLSLLAIIRSYKRPKLVIESPGVQIGETVAKEPDTIIPLATFDDLQETLYLMENTTGVRPYIMEWFEKVFVPAFHAKLSYDTKSNGKITMEESRLAVTSEQLAEKHKEVYGRTLRSKNILQTYLYPLANNGIIDFSKSEIDKRSNIYFPINPEKNILLFQNQERNNLLQDLKLEVANLTTKPTKQYIISQIEPILNYYSQSNKKFSLRNHNDEEISLEQLADEYYDNMDDYFILDELKTSSQQEGSFEQISVSNYDDIIGNGHIIEEHPTMP